MVKDYEIQMSIHVKCMHGFHVVSLMFPLKGNPFFHPVLHTSISNIQIYDMINELVLFLGFFLIETNNCVYSKFFFYYQTDGAVYVFIFGAMVVSHVAKIAGCNAIFFIYRPVSFVTFLFDVHIRIL